MRWSGLIVCAAVGALVVGSTRDAEAAERDHGARWYVDVSTDRDSACANDRVSFQREVMLACAAMGTCSIVDDPKNAELRALLRCASADQAWTLELRTVEGAFVSSTDLVGARDDRLREAAMEIARDQAPERTLAAASLQNTLGEGDRVSLHRRWNPATMSLAFGAAGTVGGVEGTSGGARALLGLAVASNANLTFGMTGLMGGSGSRASRHLRSGLGVAFGAPFDTSIIGVILEGGIDVSQSYETENRLYRTEVAETRAGGYGQGGFVFALPLRSIRPYVAFVGGAYSEPTTTVYASADAGVAFPLF